MKSLSENGIEAYYAEDSEKAIETVMKIIPEMSEVMTMTSMTLEEAGIDKEINYSEFFVSVRKKLLSMSNEKEKKKQGASSDFTLGSVHAVSEKGEIMIASNTGSQIPAYAYSSGKVLFVIGTQKIVKNLDEGFKRIYEHCLPLEDKRARKAYGVGSSVNKILIINKEVERDRIKLIFVNEVLGF